MLQDSGPKLQLEKTTLDKLIELITLLCIGFCFAYIAINYGHLPEQVPIHFNHLGEVDNYGAKSSIWVLAILALIITYGLYKLNNYPHLFNYPTSLTKENAKMRYTLAQKLIRYINLGCALLFALIIYQIITIALNPSHENVSLYKYLIYAMIGFITFFPVYIVIKQLFKKSN